MAESNKELKIAATTSGFPEAKAAASDLNATMAESAAAQTASTAATAAATPVLEKETAEELRRSAILDAQAALLREVSSAQGAAAVSIEKMAAAASVGGKVYKLAIDEAATAVARLEIAQEAVRARGGPVSPQAIAQLAAYDAAVTASAATTVKADKEYKNFSANLSLAQGQMSGLGRAAAGLSRGVGTLGAVFSFLAGPVGLAIAALALLPQLITALIGGFKSLGEWVAKFTSGMNSATKEVDAHGKALHPLSDAYQKAADKTADLVRAKYALAAGFVVATDSAAKNNAAIELHKAALHGWSIENDKVLASMKEFGLKVPTNFKEATQAATAFLDGYKLAAKEGPAAALAFVKLNKGALDTIASDFLTLGKEVPKDVQKLLDSIGLIPKAAAEAAASDVQFKKLSESIADLAAKQVTLSKELENSGKAFIENGQKIEANRAKAVQAVNDTTQKTIAGLQDQVKETEKAHAARSISESEYNATVNRLFAEMVNAKKAGYEAEVAINTDTKKEIDDLTLKRAEEVKKRKEALEDTAKAEEEAKKKLDALNVARDAEVMALAAAKPLLFQAGIDAKLLADVHVPLATNTKATAAATKDLGDQAGKTKGELGPLGTVLDGIATKLRAVEQAAISAARALASVPDGASGGGAGGGA